ncbi:MAG: rhomboid family intramembrane serine protease [Chloroflexota bacterium]|uniref:Peptidase S54 rhomboid domain-containing protein n=1 Tax=marine metagenome TaxID=408172 RepID=A0A381RST6_9ZZZZ|nr:rhomboid family intramembrane serine protease [Chloroflexota bacterium]
MFPYSDASVHHRTFPYVNAGLIGISVLVFLYEMSLSGAGILTGGAGLDLNIFFLKWGFIAQELTSGEPELVRNAGFRLVSVETPVSTVFTIFTSMFIHGGFMHLAGNMMFLWVFGDNIEDRLGHVKYLAFYLVAGVAATLSQWVINTDSQVPLIGASGAISGVLGAYLMIYPNNKVKALIILYLITVVEMRAIWLLGGWFVWQLIQGSLSIGLADSVSVAFFAHIGGFVAGMVLAGAYKLVLKEPLLPGSSRVQPWDHWYQAGRGRD